MSAIRHDWQVEEIEALFDKPFNDLLFEAQQVHRGHFDPNRVQLSTLLSIKTGACPEDCGYCSQSARNDTSLERERLLPLDEVLAAAEAAKAQGDERPQPIGYVDLKDRKLVDVEEEIQRKISLQTAIAHVEWKGKKITIFEDITLVSGKKTPCIRLREKAPE